MLARLATEADEDTLVALARQGVADHLPQHEFVEEKARDTFQRYLQTADPTVIVADDRGQAVGFAAASLADYQYTSGFFAVVDVLYVRPDKRGTRAAALLAQAVVEWTDRLGAKETFAGPTVGYRTRQTARMFQRFGFEPVGYALRRPGVL